MRKLIILARLLSSPALAQTEQEKTENLILHVLAMSVTCGYNLDMSKIDGGREKAAAGHFQYDEHPGHGGQLRSGPG